MGKRLIIVPTLIRSALILVVGAGFGIAVAENGERPRPDEPSSLRLRDLRLNSASSQDPDVRRLRKYSDERNPASEPTPPPSAQTVRPNAGLPGVAPEDK